MEALSYTSYGGGVSGLKRVEVPIPEPKKDELQVKIEAITLNPFDYKVQAGELRPFMPRKFPFTPCMDVAGIVSKVGSDVKDFKAGDKIVSMLLIPSGGGLAEYAVAKANLTVPRPPEVTAADGASLTSSGLTAYQALTRVGGLPPDGSISHIKNILITAASGGVGHFAVQLAKVLAPKSHITATCGSRNIDFVKSLGADEVLDYRTPEGASLKSPSGKKYDLIVDCTATGTPWATYSSNLSENGKVVYMTPSVSIVWTLIVKKITFSKQQLGLLFLAQKKDDLQMLVNLVKDGKLSVKIDSKYPFSKAKDAWAQCISGHATGKIIIEH